MKVKKHTLFTIFLIIIGINNVFAYETEECYYKEATDQAYAHLTVKTKFKAARLHGRKGYSHVIVEKAGQEKVENSEGIINWYTNYDKDGLSIKQVYESSPVANENGKCPEYLIVRTKDNYKSYGIFATNDYNEAKKFTEGSNNIGKYHAWTLRFKDSSGKKYTEDEYYSDLLDMDFSAENQGLGGTEVDVNCNELFGDKNDPESIRYLVDKILEYPKIIVPVLVILLGSIDFAKAVIVGKEDEMKKNQKKFIKRLIMGVALFFVPLIVDLIMSLADIVWEGLGYTTC